MPPPASSPPSRPSPRPTNSGVRAVVTAFGKHPAWRDQIDPAAAGTTSPLLEIALRRIYTDGLARACAPGLNTPSPIDRIPAARRLAGFGHTVLLLHPDGGVVGRIWNGRDALGKTNAPMGVLAAIDGMASDLGWLSDNAQPRLAAVEQMVAETQSPELVRLALGEASRQIEDTLVMQVGRPRPAIGTSLLLGQLASNDPTNVARVLAALDAAVAASGGEPIRVACALRLPAPLAERSARAWVELAQDALRERFPQRTSELPTIIALAPHGLACVDLLVGPVGPDKWAVTRADQTQQPLLAEPATPPQEQLERLRVSTSRWSRAAKDEAAPPRAAPRESSATDRPSRRGVTILVAGGVVLCATVAGLLFSRAGGTTPPAASLPDTSAEQPPTPPPTAQATPSDTDAGTLRQRIDRAQRSLDALAERSEPSDAQAIDALRAELQTLRTRTTSGERGPDLEAQSQRIATQIATLNTELAARAEALLKDAAAFAATLQDPALRARADAAFRAFTGDERLSDLREQLAQRHAAFTLADEQLASLATLGVNEAIPGLDTQALRVAWQSQREASVQRIAQAASAGQVGRVRTLAQDLTDWRSAAATFMGDAERLQHGLAIGATLDEPIPADSATGETVGSLRDLARRVRASRVQQEVPGLIGDALRRVDGLERLKASEDREALRAALAAARGDSMTLRASEAREAFERMLALAPSDAPGLREAHATLLRDVLPTLARVQDPARADALKAGASAGLLDAWSSRVRARQHEPATLAQLLALGPSIGVDAARERELPVAVQRTLAEDRLAARVTSAGKDDTLVAQAASMFLADVREIPEDPTAEAPSPAFEALRQLAVAAQPGVPVPPLLNAFGPASLGVDPASGGGWTLIAHDDEGTTLVFERTRAGQDLVRLSFVRLPTTSDSDRVTYLATTELSVAGLLAAIDAPPHRERIVPLLWQFAPGVSDPRDGPRTWEWADASRSTIRVPEAWLRPLPLPRSGAYASTIQPGEPSAQSPVQYVSPQASEAIAAALGCRLPTSAEWMGMVLLGCSSPDALRACAEGANLRDATWAAQATHVQTKGTSTVALPAAGIAPGDAKLSASKDLGSFCNDDDGELWFWPVAVGPALGQTPFVNALGNVAEWVRMDDATFGIAGSSALAPCADASSQAFLPRALQDPQAARGYSDVGLRLAFDAPKNAGLISPREALRRAVGLRAESASTSTPDPDTDPRAFESKLPSPEPAPPTPVGNP